MPYVAEGLIRISTGKRACVRSARGTMEDAPAAAEFPQTCMRVYAKFASLTAEWAHLEYPDFAFCVVNRIIPLLVVRVTIADSPAASVATSAEDGPTSRQTDIVRAAKRGLMVWWIDPPSRRNVQQKRRLVASSFTIYKRSPPGGGDLLTFASDFRSSAPVRCRIYPRWWGRSPHPAAPSGRWP